MAVVRTRGDTYHLDYNDNVIDSINTSMIATLFKYLPAGPAWTRDAGTVLYSTILGLQTEFTRLRRRVANFLDELDPRTTFEMLTDFERVYAMPDACYAPTDLASRRAELQNRMQGYGDSNIATLRAIVERLSAVGNGSSITQHPLPTTVFNPIRSADLFTCIANCNQFLYGQAEMSWFQIYTLHTGYTPWETRLPCEVNEAKQDHTVFEVFYADPNYTDVRRFTSPSARLSGVAYSPSLKRLVAVGNGSTTSNNILYSDDFGTTWSVALTGTTAFVDVKWSAKIGMFVALSSNAALMRRSVDGITWTLTAVTTTGSAWATLAVSSLTGRFVALSTTGTGANDRLMYSDDGINWVKVSATTLGTNNASSAIAWSPTLKKFAIITDGNDWLNSSDGANWTHGTDSDIATGSGSRLLAWSEYQQMFLSCDLFGAAMLSSVDGQQWVPVGTAMPTGQKSRMIYVEGLRLWMIAGDDTSGVYGTCGTCFSLDAVVWYNFEYSRNFLSLCEITDHAKVVLVGVNEAINTTYYYPV